MKRVVLTFGLIGGFIIAALVWTTATLVENRTIGFERLEIVGYSSILIALSMVFFGIKSYRDNQSKGKISFWKGVQVGVLISLIASVMYWGGAVAYGATHPGFDDRFMQRFTELKVGQLKASNAPQAEIDKAQAEVDMMAGLFKSPVLFFLICMIEMFPIGLIVALISAGLLRKKELLPVAS